MNVPKIKLRFKHWYSRLWPKDRKNKKTLENVLNYHFNRPEIQQEIKSELRRKIGL